MALDAELVGIKALDRAGLAALVHELGEPRLRAGQIVRWLYGRGAVVRRDDRPAGRPARHRSRAGWRSSAPRSSSARSRPTARASTCSAWRRRERRGGRLADRRPAHRVLLDPGRLRDGLRVLRDRASAASSRDLDRGEMVDQVRRVAGDFGRRVINAVAMGQGEPFANYDATLRRSRFINDEDGPGIGARHLTVSTCGLIPGIRRFAAEPEQFTLAVSLHSAIQATRDRLMPGVRGVAPAALREALADYAENRAAADARVRAHRRRERHRGGARRPRGFCRGMLVHVNLIPVNPVEGSGFGRAPAERVRRFERGLRACRRRGLGARRAGRRHRRRVRAAPSDAQPAARSASSRCPASDGTHRGGEAHRTWCTLPGEGSNSDLSISSVPPERASILGVICSERVPDLSICPFCRPLVATKTTSTCSASVSQRRERVAVGLKAIPGGSSSGVPRSSGLVVDDERLVPARA